MLENWCWWLINVNFFTDFDFICFLCNSFQMTKMSYFPDDTAGDKREFPSTISGR